VAVKDLIDMAGLPTTAGSRPVADAALPAERDAACLAGLRAAIDAGQARFAGKTNLHELAFGITGINGAFGTPVNPLDPRRMPGGSSSGSGTAVAAGEADIAYGTDTGGSIRIPSSVCGLYGIKPSRGRVSEGPIVPDLFGLAVNGPIARTVADAALLLDVMSGNYPGDMYTLPPLPDGETFLGHARRAPGRLALMASMKPLPWLGPK